MPVTTLDWLQAVFRRKVEMWLNDVAAECASSVGVLSGLELVIIETLRPWERQADLYAQGRTKPGQVVTNAAPGRSYHQFGLALDVGIKPRGEKFSWAWDRDPELMAGMRRISELASKRGIRWGGNFKSIVDLPHFEDGSAPSLAECNRLWPRGIKH